MKDFFVFCILFQNFLLFLHRKVCRRQKSLLSENCRLLIVKHLKLKKKETDSYKQKETQRTGFSKKVQFIIESKQLSSMQLLVYKLAFPF